jgi:hypothetical protein
VFAYVNRREVTPVLSRDLLYLHRVLLSPCQPERPTRHWRRRLKPRLNFIVLVNVIV